MKTNFTTKELFTSYKEDVLECLIGKYSLSYANALWLIHEFDLWGKFSRSPDIFEFTEPSKVAKIIMKEEY